MIGEKLIDDMRKKVIKDLPLMSCNFLKFY